MSKQEMWPNGYSALRAMIYIRYCEFEFCLGSIFQVDKKRIAASEIRIRDLTISSSRARWGVVLI